MSVSENKSKNLNPYSWSIILVYVCAVFAMQYGVAIYSHEGILQTLPLIIFAVVCCEKFAPLLRRTESELNKSERFIQDLFIVNFAFLFSCLLSLVFSCHNSDAKAWWPVIIDFMMLYGLWYSLCYALLAQGLKNHKRHTLMIACLIAVMIALGQFLPQHIFGVIETFYVVTVALLVLHGVAKIIYYITSSRVPKPN